ncbi:MAG: HipA N-terminal domain-containing protein [Candidatus Cloacimonetes bacterium]|nr:HipA N-terminal domain-containing protein [Candidatus Cloacimonadota bacterium]
MSRKGNVFLNGIFAGEIEKKDNIYTFSYDEKYYSDISKKAISLTLPKKKRIYRSRKLFPFFFGLLAEGIVKEIQCQKLRIDENDHFTRLLKTTSSDTIGGVTVEEIE